MSIWLLILPTVIGSVTVVIVVILWTLQLRENSRLKKKVREQSIKKE